MEPDVVIIQEETIESTGLAKGNQCYQTYKYLSTLAYQQDLNIITCFKIYGK